MQNGLKSIDTKQTQDVKPKRTAKNSVFLDLFQDKKNLLNLYKTLHPEDTDATEDMLDIITIDIEEISAFFPELTSDDIEEIEKEIMQLA